jgi:Flp pilus assembly pilin Flp
MLELSTRMKGAALTALRSLCRFGARAARRAPQVAQSMVEYAIIAAIVAIVAVTAVKALGVKVGNAFDNVGSQVDDSTKKGP